jgi:cytochrome c-type biogenesis protein CcmH/NrfF
MRQNKSVFLIIAEVYDVIEFGNSKKKINDKDQVGRYGNGLKS